MINESHYQKNELRLISNEEKENESAHFCRQNSERWCWTLNIWREKTLFEVTQEKKQILQNDLSSV